MEHIDIQAEKAIDWCVSRGQLQNDWLLQLKSVQNKVKNTLSNPTYAIPLETQKQMEEEGLTYWSCVKALETVSESILASRGLSASDSGKLKNFFGSYTDAPLKALSALISLYRKNNLFLAEGARCLIQAVNYDIPLLKKLIQTNTKQNEDLLRKISEEQKAAREMKNKSQQQLKENWRLNFIGNDLPEQLKKRAQEDVPELINEVITKAKDAKFGEAIEYYREFVRYSLADSSSSSTALTSLSNVFPTLQSIRSSDLLDTTKPVVDEASSSSSATVEAGGIDWGIEVEGAGSAAGSAAAIDWDISVEPTTDSSSTAPASGGIDWGDDASASPATIQWDIETTGSGAGGDEPTPASSPSLSQAPSTASLSTLESDSVRHAFLGELQELESFLAERTHDLAVQDDLSTAVFQGQGVPHILTLQSQQTTQGYLTAVRACLSALRAPRLTQLLMIRTSKRYVERVVAGIRQQFASVERLERAAVEHESRRLELLRVTSRSSHELSQVIGKTRTIKNQMETEISKLFQNRPVHIVGEINNLLAGSS